MLSICCDIIFLVLFKFGQRIDINYCLFSYVCSEERVGQEVNETFYNL